jgi:hypothetical protein
MRNSHLAMITGIWLSMVACSPSTQDKTSSDLKAVGHDAAAAVKDVASAPAAKELGADIKQGTQEAAAKTKVAADEAGDKLKAGAEDAGAKLKAGAKSAGDKTDAALNKAKDKAQN